MRYGPGAAAWLGNYRCREWEKPASAPEEPSLGRRSLSGRAGLCHVDSTRPAAPRLELGGPAWALSGEALRVAPARVKEHGGGVGRQTGPGPAGVLGFLTLRFPVTRDAGRGLGEVTRVRHVSLCGLPS